jgi:hypothetical protein
MAATPGYWWREGHSSRSSASDNDSGVMRFGETRYRGGAGTSEHGGVMCFAVLHASNGIPWTIFCNESCATGAVLDPPSTSSLDDQGDCVVYRSHFWSSCSAHPPFAK